MKAYLVPHTASALAGICLFAAVDAQASTVRVQSNSDLRTTQPGVQAQDGISAGILLHTIEGLVAPGEDGTIKPLLAESFEVSEDGLTYRFVLREGLTFHNGNPVTAESVVWSWNHWIGNDEWRCQREFDGRGVAKVVSVEASDERTITYMLDRPSGIFLAQFSRPDCGMAAVIDPASLAADGSFEKPIGTGPFMFGEWRQGESVQLTRFEGYQSLEGPVDGLTGGKRPLVDEVVFTVVPDPATALTALRSSSLDVIPFVSPSDFAGLSQDSSISVSNAPNMGMVTLLMQTRDPLLQNIALRRAIAAAIDPDQLAQAVSDGLATRNNSIVPSTSSFHTAAHEVGYEYDPERARALLEEAGYNGEPLVIQTNQRLPWSYNVAIVSQAMLQAVGINAQIEVLEWTTQLDRYWDGAYQLSAFPYSSQLDPSLSYNGVIGSKEDQAQKIWDSPTAIELLRASMEATDTAERQSIFDELHALFLEEVPMLMLYNNIDLGAASARVENYRTWQARPRMWEVSVTD